MVGVASSASRSSGASTRANISTRVVPTANRGHSRGTPVSRKARRAVCSSRAAMTRCMAGMAMNHMGKMEKNHPASLPQPTAVQLTIAAVSARAVKWAARAAQPPTRSRPRGTMMKTIPISSTIIWNTSV